MTGSWRPASLLALCLLAACREAAAPTEPLADPWFADITAKSGIDFSHDAGPTPGDHYFMPQAMGSGAALFDYDGDGRLDLYLLQNAGPKSASTNRLYHQEPDGSFKDVSRGSGLDSAGFGMGVAVGDVDNDGRPDVVVTEYGRTRLFRNQGDGTFRDVTLLAGIDNPLWGTSASFLDYDRDGWLDLVVVNYVAYDPAILCDRAGGQHDYCAPSAYQGTVTRLLHNRGKLGGIQFEDVTGPAGLSKANGPGLGVVCADFTGDRWPDILIANDGKPNHLWVNGRDGTFREEAQARGLAYNALGKAEANMGIAVGDVRGLGRLDVFVTHLASEQPTLWQQDQTGLFQDHTAAAGLTMARWRGTGFGTALADFDRDGMLDLAVVNGRIDHGPIAADTEPGLPDFWKSYAQRNQLFAGLGDGKFRDISEPNVALCGKAAVGRGLVCGDIDNDGALDLLVTAVAGKPRLLRNLAPGGGHSLTVRALLPKQGGRDAYGAEVRVQAGGRRWLSWINPAYSYLCSNDPRAHFGLGAAGQVDAIEIAWPDGTSETFPGTAADRLVTLRQGEGRAVERPR